MVKDTTTIGTWNVRTLQQSGKMGVLVEEMNHFNWSILGVSEMRWTGVGREQQKQDTKPGSAQATRRTFTESDSLLTRTPRTQF